MFSVKDATFWLQMASMWQLPWKAKVHILITERCATLYNYFVHKKPWDDSALVQACPYLEVFGNQELTGRLFLLVGLLLLALWNRTTYFAPFWLHAPFSGHPRCGYRRTTRHSVFWILVTDTQWMVALKVCRMLPEHWLEPLNRNLSCNLNLHMYVLVKRKQAAPKKKKPSWIVLSFTLGGVPYYDLILYWKLPRDVKNMFHLSNWFKKNKTKHWKFYIFFKWIIKKNCCKFWKIMHGNLNEE